MFFRVSVLVALRIIIPSSIIAKDIKKICKKYDSVERDIEPLIRELEAGETPGDRISGNKYPVYKVRIKNSNNRRGKSGGYRVIYYTVTSEAIPLKFKIERHPNH
jgi:mRNA-degrading endonuclease RelE of RelBE toxin-antitoxin system